jgi:hypothetical protein
MYLRKVTYQLGLRIKSLVPCFHKSHVENLVLMVIGMAYSRSVSLPTAAGAVPYKRIQVESRVARFERLLACRKFDPLSVLKPVAQQVLRELSRKGRRPLTVVMDRSMINDTLNLLWVAVAYEGRALPLGWMEIPHEGNSNLRQQQRLLRWLKECLPESAEVTLVADREFHSIHLARWIAERLKLCFILRIKAGTWVEVSGLWSKAGALARRGCLMSDEAVKVTCDPKADYRTRLLTLWKPEEEEPWLLLTNLADDLVVAQRYGERFWIEEMFSDHKKRGFQLEVSRLTDPQRLQRLLVAVTLAYLWVMEVGALVVRTERWRQVDNRGAEPSISLCQTGLRWLKERMNQGLLPPLFTGCFRPLEVT